MGDRGIRYGCSLGNTTHLIGWLRGAIERGGGTHSFQDVMAKVLAGDFQLWVGPDGAAVTQVVDFPQKRVLHVLYAGGEMQQIIDFQESAATWGRALGCSEMTLSGRMGWQRVLKDWTPQSVVMSMEL